MNAPSADAGAREAVARLFAADVVAQQLGMRVIEAGTGRAVLSMCVGASMANGHGICHGGMIFALADTAFAYACNGGGGVHLAASASIDFVAAAQLGDVLRAEAIQHWHAGRSGLTDVRVLDQSGRLIAMFRGRSRRLGRGDPAAAEAPLASEPLSHP